MTTRIRKQPKQITPETIARSGTEHGEQAAFFKWLRDIIKEWRHLGYLKWVHAIPNGGQRSGATAARLKAEGVRRGVSDVFVPLTCTKYAGFYMEFKRNEKAALSDEQIEFSVFVKSQGYKFARVNSWQEARAQLLEYVRVDCGKDCK